MQFSVEIPDSLPETVKYRKIAELAGIRHEDIAEDLGLHRVTVTRIIRSGVPEATFGRICRYIEQRIDDSETVSRIDHAAV